MRVTVLTYGDGGERYLEDRERLSESAAAFGADSVVRCDRSSLDPAFRRLHERVLSERRGDGYWLWKPYIIDAALSSLPDGEVLFYVDADQRFTRPVKEACARALAHQRIFFRQLPPQYPEQHWTKADAFYYFGVLGEVGIRTTPQFEANRLILAAGPETRRFVRAWLAACCAGALITDEPGRIDNFSGFREHRHDQSMFSLGAKTAGLRSFDWSEAFWRELVKSDDDLTYCR